MPSCQVHCQHSTHACSRSPEQMSDFAASFLFSLGFSERLVAPKKTLDIRVLLANLLKSAKLSFSALSLALRYMQKYAENNPANLQYSVYPVFVTALVAASKYLEDNTFTNKTWSILTGFRLSELNGLEIHFLNALRYRLHVSQHEYDEWLAHLLTFAEKNQLQFQLQQQQQYSDLTLLDETQRQMAQLLCTSTQQQQQQQVQQQQPLVSHEGVCAHIQHLRSQHFGQPQPQPHPQTSYSESTSNPLKARRARSPPHPSQQPQSHQQQQQPQQAQLPPFASLLTPPSSNSSSPLASANLSRLQTLPYPTQAALSARRKQTDLLSLSPSPLGKFRPYPEVGLASHLPKLVPANAAPVFMSQLLPAQAFPAQYHHGQPDHSELYHQKRTLPAPWVYHQRPHTPPTDVFFSTSS